MIRLKLSLIFPLIIVRFAAGLKQITKKKKKKTVYFYIFNYCLLINNF